MLSHAIVPILAAGAFAAPPPAYPTAAYPTAYPTASIPAAYPTSNPTSAGPSYPKASDSDFIRLSIFLKGDSVPDGSEFPYDTASYLNGIPSTDYFGRATGEDRCSGQVIWTSLQVPEPADYYLSPVSATNSSLILRRDVNIAFGRVMHIASIDEADSQGRRSVNQTNCEGQLATPGLRVELEPFARLTYDDKEGFGSWYTCWVPENYLGPSLFYRSSKETTPAACRDIWLISDCGGPSSDNPYAGEQVNTACYGNQYTVIQAGKPQN